MQAFQRFLLVVCFFVCPLLFFTNLTRNPYITQICLLNIGLLLATAWLLLRASRRGASALPRTALDAPLAAWVAVCALSWGVAYALHAPFFRPSIVSEGQRAFLFLLANSLCPFYLAASLSRDGADSDVEIAPWAFFALLWGVMWMVFPQARGPAAPPADIWGHAWDGYGALVWAGGVAAALWLCRRGRWADFSHLALTSGFLASVYAVLQYFNKELIWPNSLNPYGGRSVSTFGNPNFMSSYNVVLLPLAFVLFSRARGGRRLVYAALTLALEAALLCSLTRSSWGGALTAVAVLLLSPDVRRSIRQDPRPHGLLAAAAVALALLWPSSSIVSGYTPSVLGRLSEIVVAAREGTAYGSFFQRVLIWTSGWLMGAENPLTGKGYGLFELFYPFYQGHIVGLYDFYRYMRTHANNGHNEIVEVWAQTGLLGLGVFAWLWATFFESCRRRLSGLQAGGAVLAACAAGTAGMLADNLLNVSLHFAVPGFIFWWTAGSAMGLASGVVPSSPAKAAAPVPGRAWRGGLTIAAVALAALSWIWVRVWFREAHYFAGFKLLRQRNFALALKELERSRQWGPREVNAIYELGNAYAQAERFPEADKTYAEALRANAGYDEIYYNIAAIKSARLGQTEEAVKFFSIARWINPVSAEVYNSLGNLYLADPARHADQAVELLNAAVRYFPDNPNHWNNLGYLYTLRRQWLQAEEAYTRALTIDPALAIAERNLAAAAQQSGRPRPPILAGLQGLRELEARVMRHDYSEATLMLAQRLDRQFPEMPKTRFFVGSLLMARGRAAEAVAPLQWVAARQPGHVWARVNLGEALLSLGRRDEALQHYRAAASLDPSNAQAQQRLRQLTQGR